MVAVSMLLAALALALLPLVRAHRPCDVTVSPTLQLRQPAFFGSECSEPRRSQRETHSLIAPFDISKMFKKNKNKSKTKEVAPSASSLQGGQLLPQATSPLGAEALRPPSSSSFSTTPRTIGLTMTASSTLSTSSPEPQRSSEGYPMKIDSHTENSPPKSLLGSAKIQVRSGNTSGIGGETPVPVAPGAVPARLLHHAKLENATAAAWPVKHAAVVDGDVILGGLMMVSLTRASRRFIHIL